MATAESIEAIAADLGLSMDAKFVPWSLSRNAGDRSPSLNWKVSLLHKGRVFLTTDYGAGMAHCPSFTDGMDRVKRECESGRSATGKPIMPKFADVLYCLTSEADAIDYGSFEEWAESLGEDTDSRKAEKTYRACLETGLKLRNAVGEDGLSKLREACQDY